MNIQLSQLVDALEQVRQNPSSALALTLLRERTKSFANSVNSDVCELVHALNNLLMQINSGVLQPSDRFVQILNEAEDFFQTNHELEVSQSSVNELLSKVDYEASGGGVKDLSAEKEHGTSTRKLAIPEKKKLRTSSKLKIKPKSSRPKDVDEDEASKSLSQAQTKNLQQFADLSHIYSALQRTTNGLYDAISSLKRRQPDNATPEVQASFFVYADRLNNLTEHLKQISLALIESSAANPTITSSQIAQLIQTSYQVDKPVICNQRFTLSETLWSQIQVPLAKYLDDLQNTTLHSIKICLKNDEFLVSLSIETHQKTSDQDKPASQNRIESLRQDLADCGGKIKASTNDTKEHLCLSVPVGNVVLPTLLGTINSDTFAIPMHSVIEVIPVSNHVQKASQGELTHNQQSYPIVELAHSDEPYHYYVLVQTMLNAIAVPFRLIKPDQKLTMRMASTQGSRWSPASANIGSTVCLIPDLDGRREQNQANFLAPLQRHLLVVMPSFSHFEFVRNLCTQFGLEASRAESLSDALVEFKEYRPLAILLFKYADYQGVFVEEKEIQLLAETNEISLMTYDYRTQDAMKNEENDNEIFSFLRTLGETDQEPTSDA